MWTEYDINMFSRVKQRNFIHTPLHRSLERSVPPFCVTEKDPIAGPVSSFAALAITRNPLNVWVPVRVTKAHTAIRIKTEPILNLLSKFIVLQIEELEEWGAWSKSILHQKMEGEEILEEPNY